MKFLTDGMKDKILEKNLTELIEKILRLDRDHQFSFIRACLEVYKEVEKK